MSQVPEDERGTEALSAQEQLAAIRLRFETAWNVALKTGREPDLEAFLGDTPEPLRFALRQELGKIERQYRPHLLDVSKRTTQRHSDPTAVMDRPESPGATVDHTPGAGNTIELPPHSTEQPQGTLDYVASGPPSPDATIDRAALPKDLANPGFALSESSATSARGGQNTIAGYEILEVLGRGAMGVVYKARQRGLKRIVALKMILAGDHAGEDELTRFRTEAEAAGQLQHVNIVQVYEVGEHEGRPFLSLEYVSGGSLKQRLEGKPQPVLAAAQLIQVLAQAMDFAHRHGVIHRDLKPANVMLTDTRASGSSDSTLSKAPLVEELYGVPKIADFGLAKRLEEDKGQTRSGTILGTPSYMAPEQAEGRSKEVGPLADQYALGAVLYELLTGRPPFQGQTVWDTLDQVRSQEPVPPSRLQPKVPRDLETVCLKALQKDPNKRYPTTGALAEDLRRFVAGEPIHARPVSAPERFWRWCRRNPKVATLSGFLALSIVVALVGLSWFTIRLSNEKKATEQQKEFAEEQEQIAEANADAAQEQRGLALNALGNMVTSVQGELEKKEGTLELRKKILEMAMKDLDKVWEKRAPKVSLKDSTLAAACVKMGGLSLQLGEVEQGFEQLKRSQSIYAALVQLDPTNAVGKANLAIALMQLGSASLEMQGRSAIAQGYFQDAVQLLRELDAHPVEKLPPAAIKSMLAESLLRVGSVMVDTNPVAALGRYEEALRLRTALFESGPDDNAKRHLVNSCILVAGAAFRVRDSARTKELYDRALKLCEELTKAHPDNLSLQDQLGNTEHRMGDFLLRTGHPDQAAREYEAALARYQRLAEREPKNDRWRQAQARAHYDLAAAALRRGDPKIARKHFQESLALREARYRREPKVADSRKDLMVTLARCGEHVRAAQMAQELWRESMSESGSLVAVAYCLAGCVAAVGQGKDAKQLTVDECKLRDGYRSQAVDALRQAVTLGYRDVVNIETDPDFDPLRGDAGFQLVLAELARLQGLSLR
jgi:serine/threonine-protein kinase